MSLTYILSLALRLCTPVLLISIGGMFVLNPGTAGQGLNRTWAKLELGSTGEIHCEICKIK